MGQECFEKQQETLCWDCQNCTRCSWADGIPVKGWTATPTVVRDYDGDYKSYIVTECPIFKKDDKREVFISEIGEILGKTKHQITRYLRGRDGVAILNELLRKKGFVLYVFPRVEGEDGKARREFIIKKLSPKQ